MSLFHECCVLIPASTLEDFPATLPEEDARSLLAAWTVLWHPSLLVASGQLPAWYRADTPPSSLERRLLAVPTPSLRRLPDGFAQRAAEQADCHWISGASRAEMLGQLPQSILAPLPASPLTWGRRTIALEDFFAAGYALLQIQVMTRRLRYTSNLDEMHLQTRAVAAAQAFLDGDAKQAITALHDVFDCLAEERDHYFSSDPHLIDLVLTSRSSIGSLLELVGKQPQPIESPTPETDDADAPLATPLNLLIDAETAEAIGELDSPITAGLREQLRQEHIGWAGGGPAPTQCLDALTYAQAEALFAAAHAQSEKALGVPPQVYGRFGGGTPGDVTAALVRLGYCGMIPIDFAAGTGFGEESKVILAAGGSQLEALTAKPIDASSSVSFLTLGIRLGEAIDRGEIATGLLAHWPGRTCEAFDDLKRVASWSLCLGRFWNLANYFRLGEHPYHHGSASSSSAQSADSLSTLVASGAVDPLSSLAGSFCRSIAEEQRQLIAGMRDLVTGLPTSSGNRIVGPVDPEVGFAAAIGAPLTEKPGQAKGTLLINSHSGGCRHNVSLGDAGVPKSDFLYGLSNFASDTVATVDIPGCGFVLLKQDPDGRRDSRGLARRFREKLLGPSKPIAEAGRLHNEFMDVTLSSQSGGISGVYSGTTRGNRLSFRLVREGLGGNDATVMHCDQLRILSASSASGTIEAIGSIRRAKGDDDSILADYQLRYTLQRGSRFLQIEVELKPRSEIVGDPWTHYVAARTAVASETPICRTLVRDKLHRAKSRRLVAPLGVLIDEAERQTLICANGLAYHRRVGERFLDTLLLVQGEQQRQHVLHLGMDVPAPINGARARLVAPWQLNVATQGVTSTIGWLVHAAPKDLLVTQLQVFRREDGRLATLVRIIQTQPQTCKARLRFLRDVACAVLVDGPPQLLMEKSLEDLEGIRSRHRTEVQFEGDLITLAMPSHGVVDVLVVFGTSRGDS